MISKVVRRKTGTNGYSVSVYVCLYECDLVCCGGCDRWMVDDDLVDDVYRGCLCVRWINFVSVFQYVVKETIGRRKIRILWERHRECV